MVSGYTLQLKGVKSLKKHLFTLSIEFDNGFVYMRNVPMRNCSTMAR